MAPDMSVGNVPQPAREMTLGERAHAVADRTMLLRQRAARTYTNLKESIEGSEPRGNHETSDESVAPLSGIPLIDLDYAFRAIEESIAYLTAIDTYVEQRIAMPRPAAEQVDARGRGMTLHDFDVATGRGELGPVRR